MLKNLVQPFGLPKSGTNFLEWSLVHNFKGLDYMNLYTKGNIPQFLKHRKRQSVKHCFPCLDYSDKAIIIVKEFDNWVESMTGEGWGKYASKQIYDTYLQRGYDLPINKRVVLKYEHFNKYYNNALNHIAGRLNLELSYPIIKPKYKLNKEGAKCEESAIKFDGYIDSL